MIIHEEAARCNISLICNTLSLLSKKEIKIGSKKYVYIYISVKYPLFVILIYHVLAPDVISRYDGGAILVLKIIEKEKFSAIRIPFAMFMYL